MVVGLIQLLAFSADLLCLALLAFLVGRTRDAVAGVLLVTLALFVVIGADFMVLSFDGRRSSSPGVLWHFFQLCVLVTVGGLTFISNGARGAIVLAYATCIALMSCMLVMSIVARDASSSASATVGVCCLYSGLMILCYHFHVGLIPRLAQDLGGQTAARSMATDTSANAESLDCGPDDQDGRADQSTRDEVVRLRVASLRWGLWGGFLANIVFGGFAALPWGIIVINYDSFGFMPNPAAGPVWGTLLVLFSLAVNPGVVIAGTLMAYVTARYEPRATCCRKQVPGEA